MAFLAMDTFEVSENEARELAQGLVALAEGWGDVRSSSIDWKRAVIKRLDGKKKWKSETARQEFLRTRSATVSAYERLIRPRCHF